jgi:hypothetical protein
MSFATSAELPGCLELAADTALATDRDIKPTLHRSERTGLT